MKNTKSLSENRTETNMAKKRCRGFWEGLPSIPVHHLDPDGGGSYVVDHKTGKFLGHNKFPTGPNGKPMEVFVRYPAIALRDYEKTKLKAGKEIWVEMNPGGQVRMFLTKESIVSHGMDTYEGVDWRYA